MADKGQKSYKATSKINKKKKFVGDGVFRAELHEFFAKALADAGYAGLSIRNFKASKQLHIKVTKQRLALGESGQRLNELEALVRQKYGYSENALTLYIDSIDDQKTITASAQAEVIKAKLTKNIPPRTAAQSVINACKKRGNPGCEVIISGKLRQQRAKTMKFKYGYIISSGQPNKDFVDVAVRHVFFKQGIMGVKVKIMLNETETRKLPDKVVIRDPKVAGQADGSEARHRDGAEGGRKPYGDRNRDGAEGGRREGDRNRDGAEGGRREGGEGGRTFGDRREGGEGGRTFGDRREGGEGGRTFGDRNRDGGDGGRRDGGEGGRNFGDRNRDGGRFSRPEGGAPVQTAQGGNSQTPAPVQAPAQNK